MSTTDKVLTGVLVVAALALLSMTHNKTRALEKQLELVIATQQEQKKLDEAVRDAVYQLREREAITTREVHYATREIERANGAGTPLPPDVDAAWRAGIERVRGKNPGSDASVR